MPVVLSDKTALLCRTDSLRSCERWWALAAACRALLHAGTWVCLELVDDLASGSWSVLRVAAGEPIAAVDCVAMAVGASVPRLDVAATSLSVWLLTMVASPQIPTTATITSVAIMDARKLLIRCIFTPEAMEYPRTARFRICIKYNTAALRGQQ